MLKNEIRSKIFSKNTEAREAWKEVVSIYKNPNAVLKTGWKELDHELIGGLDNKMVFIGSRPAMGKTHNCSTLIRNLISKEVNPSLNVQVLRINLEMTTKDLLLRELKIALKRDMRDILKNGVTTEEDKATTDRVIKNVLDHKNITNFSSPLVGDEFTHLIESFLEKADASGNDGLPVKKVIVIDHLHVYPSKEVIDGIIRLCNAFKISVPGISFLCYFQFNREAHKMWTPNKDGRLDHTNMLYTQEHIFMTDALIQYADIVLGLTIPQVVGLDEFCLAHRERDKHLSPHFLPGDPDKSFVKLKGRNRIYYNFVKRRMLDNFEDPTLFCEILDKSYDSAVEEQYKEKEEDSQITAPNFNQNTGAILNAQGGEFTEESINELFNK